MKQKRKTRITMWYKVQEFTSQGLNKSQIRQETGLDRATIGKYQQMDERAFHEWIQTKNHLPRKLKAYRQQVRQMLEKAPYLSAAQVEDRLKETHSDLPEVHSKTVYNFVQAIRREHAIAKPTKGPRIFIKLEQLPYGRQGQVDFGETWMQDKAGKRHKVHFFTMVLSRSRQKYVCFQPQPFTAEAAVKAHYLAFEFFQGTPQQVLYDQDRVFVYDENLGDFLLTGAFNTFCNGQGFQAVFCRKADPQSKGKVENVVKYIKQNFIRGREYVNAEVLNQQALSWLSRTANAKVHATTQLVPQAEWEIEKSHLLVFTPLPREVALRSYKVRKDHTFCYKSNFYSLPEDTYQGPESYVLLKVMDQEIEVYTPESSLLCTHAISHGKGQLICKTDHRRKKSKTLEMLQKQAQELLGDDELARDYLKRFRDNKSRYFRDNLQYMITHYKGYPQAMLTEALLMSIENKIFNAKDLITLLNKKQQQQKAKVEITPKEPAVLNQATLHTIVETSDIHTYEKLF